MEGSIELTNSQKHNLFIKYIEDCLEDNEKDYQNKIIDNLIYTKNKLFLQTLKKDKIKYKNIEKTDIIIKNDIIYEIKNIQKNENGLIYFFNNKSKQSKITDNYKYRKRNNNNIKIENKKSKSNINKSHAFLI
jgi:hypothetical protein